MNNLTLLSAAWGIQCRHPSEKIVLLFLADKAGSKGICWPSVSTICKKTELSRKTVFRCLRELRKLGLISVTSGRINTKGTSNLSNQYVLNIPGVPSVTVTPPPSVTTTLASVTMSHPLVSPRHPNPNSTTHNEPKGGGKAPKRVWPSEYKDLIADAEKEIEHLKCCAEPDWDQIKRLRSKIKEWKEARWTT